MIVLVQGFQNALVKQAAVSHHREAFQLADNAAPSLGKRRRLFGVFLPDSVYFGRPKVVIVWNGTQKTIEVVHHFVIAHDDDAHAARARQFGVGRLEIDGRKVVQMVFRDVGRPFRIRPIGQFYLLFVPFPKHSPTI